MLIRKYFLIVSLACFSCSVVAQKKPAAGFTHVEPAFWWVGMNNPSLQILFHNDKTNISSWQPEIKQQGIVLKNVARVDNPHYIFLELDVSQAKAGSFPIVFKNGNKTITYQYELKRKSQEKNRIQGFDASDVVYLIMPDRFANGDVKNDSVPGMYEGAHPEKPGARHGGDLKGISDHLNYIKDLGMTAIWLNPVLENNQKHSSYHGYAITDLYNVDRRFGGNAAYLDFINQCHASGLKVIQDMVMNHIGNDHWLMHDLPEKTWINQWPEFTRSNYQGNVISDPYQSNFDREKMNNGWFDTSMPDVNQKNPLFATYLIQNSLWWIEHAGIDGIRMDTHPYPDKEFMARYCKEIMDEYPSFNIVGEVWINSIPTTAYWQDGMKNRDGYDSNLPTVTDFPFCFSVPQALTEDGGWDTGMRRLYTLLSQDFIYPDPNHNLTFLDNHDMTRFFLSVGRDVAKFKQGVVFLLTTRGIPQIYYGTELLMDGDGGFHPNIRKDMPGGWPGDKVNAFSKEGRTAEQNDAFDFMRTLLNWRKDHEVIYTGKLTHYIPEDNIYVYFRHNDKSVVMVVLNANKEDKELDTQRFSENLRGLSEGKEYTGNPTTLGQKLQIPKNSFRIIEFNR